MIAIHSLRFMHYAVPTRPDTMDYSNTYPCYTAYRFATRRPTIKLPPEFVSLPNTYKNSSTYNGDILRACWKMIPRLYEKLCLFCIYEDP